MTISQLKGAIKHIKMFHDVDDEAEIWLEYNPRTKVEIVAVEFENKYTGLKTTVRMEIK